VPRSSSPRPRPAADQDALASRRLPDIVTPGLRVLFVGINPGLRSALLGHHFAGYSNRFWKLLHEATLVPVPLTFEDDRRLPEWGYGLTNLVARPTAGLADLSREELLRGRAGLMRTLRRWQPRVVALVGITVYRAVFPAAAAGVATVGDAPERLGGSRVVVLPNPSGRNAHYPYPRMLEAYRALADLAERANRGRDNFGTVDDDTGSG
jgi:double-stranded uracil-DNA glycosylase